MTDAALDGSVISVPSWPPGPALKLAAY